MFVDIALVIIAGVLLLSSKAFVAETKKFAAQNTPVSQTAQAAQAGQAAQSADNKETAPISDEISDTLANSSVSEPAQKAKKQIYFKRVKAPVNNLKEAKNLQNETRIYFLISLLCLIASVVLFQCVKSLMVLSIILIVVSAIFTFYFGLMSYAIKRAVKRLKNLQCECGAQLVYDENTSWRELNRRWADSKTNGSVSSKLYVTVGITCQCPKCGKIKSFKDTLCGGKISITDSNSEHSTNSTQTLVRDYFAGIIHC